MTTPVPAVKLLSGVDMPILGYGTFRLAGKDVIYKSLETALLQGYRSIDTAAVYRNEEDIGRALKSLYPKVGIKRKDLFITSKLAPNDQGDRAYQACLESLKKLQMDYLDLYLIHWPGSKGLKLEDPRNKENRKNSWKMLEKLKSEGHVRSIGVSNYTKSHLEEMKNYANIMPDVLQVEYHPHYTQEELLAWCHQHNTHLQAYRSIGQSQMQQEPVVQQLVVKYAKSSAQILLRWAIQQSIGIIPKSSHVERIRENFEIWDFELNQNEMEALSSLKRHAKYCWDPTAVI